MSAWLLDPEHWDVVAHLIVRHVDPTLEVRKVFETLAEENCRSYEARYSHIPDAVREVASARGTLHQYALQAGALPEVPGGAIYKAAGCYGYQSCEHDGWEDSIARAWTHALEKAYERDGYRDSSGWPIDADVLKRWLTGDFS